MLKRSINLTAKDVEEIVLSKYGIKKLSSKKETIKYLKCRAVNTILANYRWRCNLSFKAKAVKELEERTIK